MPDQSAPPAKAIDWDILLHELESGKCVLCLGPDVYSNDDTTRVEKKLADTLRAKSGELGIRVYDDGWFHYLPLRDEFTTWFTIKQFYESRLQAATDALLSKFAALPFHLVLNFSPDYRLRMAFQEARGEGNFEFDCLYKNPDLNTQRLPADYLPTKAKPLVFNMLGEIDDKDSLVMTYDDLFSYLEAFFDKKRMPNCVRLKIQQASHFIFLGMPLDKWYFHLFMRVLNMHRDTAKTKRYAATYSVNGHNATFCEEQYSLTFIQRNIGDFAEQLGAKWQAAHTAQTQAEPQNRYDYWRELAATGEDKPLRKLFSEMKDAIRIIPQNDALSNQQILSEMQWNGFASGIFETLMARNAVKAQILNGVLDIVRQIEKISPEPARP